MIKSTTHFAVNWIDGMKISQKHFDAQANFTIDNLRDIASLYINSFNYGLLPFKKFDSNNEILFNIYNTVTNDVQIDIKECRAISPAGHRIELINYSTNLKSLSKKQTDSLIDEEKVEYFIVVSVNLFSKVPHGDIDLEETPPRHPFIKPNYYVELMPTSTFDTASVGGNYIVIGKASIQGTVVKADTNFIPPCTSLFSHPMLMKFYADYAVFMSELQQHATKIIQKNVNTKQNTKLAANIKTLCEIMLSHVGNVYFQFRNILPSQPPIYTVDIFSQLAIHLHNATETFPPLELEEILNYINEWSEVAPHTFLNLLSAVAEINYNHVNCDEIFNTIKNLLINLDTVLNKLSDLDYIGQRKENIVVNEQNITTTVKINKGWSILD